MSDDRNIQASHSAIIRRCDSIEKNLLQLEKMLADCIAYVQNIHASVHQYGKDHDPRRSPRTFLTEMDKVKALPELESNNYNAWRAMHYAIDEMFKRDGQ